MRGLIVSFVLIQCLTSPLAHAQDKRDWRIEAAPGTEAIAQWHADELSQILKDLLPGTTLSKYEAPEYELLQRVSDGDSAIALIKLDSLAEISEDFTIFASPSLTLGYDDANSLIDLLNPLADRLFAREGLKLLSLFHSSLRGLYSTRILDSAESLDGLTFLATDLPSINIGKVLNADVTPADYQDLAYVFEQGHADVVLASATTSFEVKTMSARYVNFYDIHVAAPIYGVVTSDDFFQSLGEGDKEALELAAKLTASATSQRVSEFDREALSSLSARNLNVQPPPPGVLEKLRAGLSITAERIRGMFGVLEGVSDAIRIKIYDWWDQANDPGGCTVTQLLYATNRQSRQLADGIVEWAPGPMAGPLRVGQLSLSVPKPRAREAQYDSYRCNKELRGEFGCKGDLTVRLCRLEDTPLSPGEFVQLWRLSPSEGLLLYVHGHAVGFDEAARQAVALRDRIGRMKVAVFSWPVIGWLGKEEYLEDRETSRKSGSFLVEFFQEYLNKVRPLSHVSLVAHSLGNMALFEAVRDYRPPSQAEKFTRLLSVAAAVPQKEFQALAAQISQKVEHSTIYTTEYDAALKLSRGFTGEVPVGLRPPTVKIHLAHLDDIDIVDASGISCRSSSDSCHSYHLESPSMIVELRDVFKGALPSERGLIRKEFGEIYYYYIPSD